MPTQCSASASSLHQLTVPGKQRNKNTETHHVSFRINKFSPNPCPHTLNDNLLTHCDCLLCQHNLLNVSCVLTKHHDDYYTMLCVSCSLTLNNFFKRIVISVSCELIFYLYLYVLTVFVLRDD